MGQAGFILKVIAISVGLSALIKYSNLTISVPATINVLVIVLMPTLILAIALWWRTSNQQTD